LAKQGEAVAPTGNFSALTQAAVARFQEKYAAEILAPARLLKGTGYVGVLTRAKINKILAAR
jgi:peptidoglycan hydrolase-like protein with peptidoglycan-binding domain